MMFPTKFPSTAKGMGFESVFKSSEENIVCFDSSAYSMQRLLHLSEGEGKYCMEEYTLTSFDLSQGSSLDGFSSA